MQKICPQGHRRGAVHTLVIPPPKRLPTGTTAETPVATGAPEEYLGGFCRHLAEDGKSPKTIESYAGDVAGFLAHLSDVGEEFNGQIKRFHVTGFRNHLLERGYQVSTVNKKVNSLASFNRHLVAIGLMEDTVVNPRRDRVRVASGSERQVEVYTEGQLERLLHFVRGCRVSPRDRAIVMVLLYTGVRVSELCGIRLRNLDLLTGSLRVTGKGGKVREMPLRPEVTDAVSEYLAERAKSRHAESERLFLGQRGPLGRDAVNTLLEKIAARAGLEARLKPHTFRHTFCTRLVRKGRGFDACPLTY